MEIHSTNMLIKKEKSIMGFLDKIKGVAKSTIEQVEKTVNEHTSPPISGNELTKDIPSLGNVLNTGIETNLNKKVTLKIDVDNANKILVVQSTKNPLTMKEKNIILEEYDFEDVIEFKYTDFKADQPTNDLLISYYSKIILSSGKEIDIFSNYRWYSPEKVKDDYNNFYKQSTIDAFFLPLQLFLPFYSLIKDNENKLYINQIYEAMGYLPLCDEEGNILFKNMDTNDQTFKKDYLSK